MLMDDRLKQAIRDFYSRVSTGLPSFKSRAGQRQMIGAIATTLAHTRVEKDVVQEGQSIIVVEGKTGVGKTVGYLVPSLIMAKQLKKKLILSTATVALQEQLFERDLPMINAFLDEPLKVALAKGRRRYVCPVRLTQVAGHAGQDGLFEDDPAQGAWERKPEDVEVRFLRRMGKALDSGDWSGDRDEFSETIPNELWGRVTTDSTGCSKRKCHAFKECPYYTARAATLGADVIVANHDLVISCRASMSNLLPDAGDSIYVFDEAHHLPDVALARFAKEAPLSASARWLDRIGPSIAPALAVVGQVPEVRGIGEALTNIRDRLIDLANAFRHGHQFEKSAIYRYPNGQLDDGMISTAKDILNGATGAVEKLNALDALLTEAVEAGQASASALETTARDLGAHLGRLAEFVELWELFLETPPDGVPPHAKWISMSPDGREFSVHASPISAARVLHRHLWSAAAAVVLTSATITTLGDFRYYLKKSGLSRLPKVTTQAVVSHFDYQRQGKLLVPAMRNDPKQVEGHTDEIAALLPGLLATSKRGSLVLFASRRQMQAVHTQLPADLSAVVLMQGQMSRTDLIRTHRKRIESGQRSILFGLAGLGEGLDLPGALCEHVIIAKIPFPPPDSPMEEALAEWITKCKGNPFAELTLPKAGLILVQWTGRLIRTEEDQGQITILDRRIRTKTYGSMLLRGLPSFEQIAARP